MLRTYLTVQIIKKLIKSNMTENTIISKVWNFASVLRDDGVSYGDYLEQITYLLFLKMANELNKPPYNKGLKFPKLKNAQSEEIKPTLIFFGLKTKV
ncbi:MAG: type I restriction-modification system subunit M N-terminal domain-containing protein [Bacteroidota bacterium]|nr:type I restriction-modification system subunit M N-terminal domain-containing protein [Bacteroidota bacterium]